MEKQEVEKYQNILIGNRGCGKSYLSILIIEKQFRDGCITKKEKKELIKRGFAAYQQQQESKREELYTEPYKKPESK